MAQSGVELHITAETGKAAQQLGALLAKMDGLQDKLDNAGAKGKSAFDGIGGSIGSMIAGVTSGLSIMKLLGDALEIIKGRAAAAREEMQRTAEAGSRNAAAFADLLTNLPTRSPQERSQIQAIVAAQADRSTLGQGARGRFAQAAQAVAGQPLSLNQFQDVLQATGGIAEIAPGADLSAIAKSVSELMLRSGGRVSAGGAQGLIMGRLGQVSSVTGRAQLAAGLEPFAKQAGLDEGQMMGLGGTVSTLLGDTQGQETATVIQGLIGRLMTDPHQLEKDIGTRLHGNLLERFQQTRQRMEHMSGDRVNRAFADFGRGPGGRLIASQLFGPEGAALLGQETATVMANLAQSGTAARRLDEYRETIPGFRQSQDVGRSAAGAEARRLQRTGDMDNQAEMAALEEEQRLAGSSTAYRDLYSKRYDVLRRDGFDPAAARSAAAGTASAASIPLVGGMVSRMAEMQVPGEKSWMDRIPDSPATMLSNAVKNPSLKSFAAFETLGASDLVLGLLHRLTTSNERMANQSSTPQRPLNQGDAASR